MARHDLPFPNKDSFSMLNGLKDVLPNRIEECWRNGIFDEYSDQHFLIRALYNDAEFFIDLIDGNLLISPRKCL